MDLEHRVDQMELDMATLRKHVEEHERRSDQKQDTIMSQLEELGDQMQEMKLESTRVWTKLESDRRVSDLHQDMYGPPEPGVKTQVDRLTQDSNRMSKLIWMVLGTLVSTVVGGCITAVVALGG